MGVDTGYGAGKTIVRQKGNTHTFPISQRRPVDRCSKNSLRHKQHKKKGCAKGPEPAGKGVRFHKKPYAKSVLNNNGLFHIPLFQLFNERCALNSKNFRCLILDTSGKLQRLQ